MKRTSILLGIAFVALILVGIVGISLAEETHSHSHGDAAAMACCGGMEKFACAPGHHDVNKEKVVQVLTDKGAIARIAVPDPNEKPTCQEMEHDLNKEKVVQVLTDKGAIARIAVPDPSQQEGRCAHASNMLCKAAQPQDLNKVKIVQALTDKGAIARITVPEELQGPCCTPAPEATSDSGSHTHNHSL